MKAFGTAISQKVDSVCLAMKRTAFGTARSRKLELFCLAAQADEKLLAAQLAAVEREASAAARQLAQSTAELAALEGLAGGVGRKRAGLEEQVCTVAVILR